jgi:hypothetical protein
MSKSLPLLGGMVSIGLKKCKKEDSDGTGHAHRSESCLASGRPKPSNDFEFVADETSFRRVVDP